tara:strand:+ start:2874 stop:3932 length:1059 start_codon:yes stop_codon:yes gene_type:complete
MNLKNTLILDALKGNNIDRTPIWIMRQAGRYLPEYKETREKAGSFINLCKSPDLASEVTIQPISRFDLDAAIIFSDILTIPDAMGMELKFQDAKGPYFEESINSEDDIQELNDTTLEKELSYVPEAIIQAKNKLNNEVPLIGFSGSPWTIATYMIEGQATKDFTKVRSHIYKSPNIIEKLNEKLVKAVSSYLIMQAKSGADVLMIFDSWGGLLNNENYINFSLNPIKKIITNLKSQKTIQAPIIVFSKGCGRMLKNISESGCDGIGLDWTMDLSQARKVVGDNITLQGNLDPCVLHGSDETIKNEADKILNAYGKGHRHIFNLGHGIDKNVNPEKVSSLVKHVHESSKKFHN